MLKLQDKHRMASERVAAMTTEQCKAVLRDYGITHFNKRLLRIQTIQCMVAMPKYWQ